MICVSAVVAMVWVRFVSCCHSAMRPCSSGILDLMKLPRIPRPSGPMSAISPNAMDGNSCLALYVCKFRAQVRGEKLYRTPIPSSYLLRWPFLYESRSLQLLTTVLPVMAWATEMAVAGVAGLIARLTTRVAGFAVSAVAVIAVRPYADRSAASRRYLVFSEK